MTFRLTTFNSKLPLVRPAWGEKTAIVVNVREDSIAVMALDTEGEATAAIHDSWNEVNKNFRPNWDGIGDGPEGPHAVPLEDGMSEIFFQNLRVIVDANDADVAVRVTDGSEQRFLGDFRVNRENLSKTPSMAP